MRVWHLVLAGVASIAGVLLAVHRGEAQPTGCYTPSSSPAYGTPVSPKRVPTRPSKACPSGAVRSGVYCVSCPPRTKLAGYLCQPTCPLGGRRVYVGGAFGLGGYYCFAACRAGTQWKSDKRQCCPLPRPWKGPAKVAPPPKPSLKPPPKTLPN